MKKAKLPSWFSPHGKPYAPFKPQKIIEQGNAIAKLELSNYGSSKLPEEIKKADEVYCEVELNSYDSGSVERVTLTFTASGECENSNYKSELKKYKKDYIVYKAKLEEWEKYKAIYDKQEAEQILASKRELYQRLKAELEGVKQ